MKQISMNMKKVLFLIIWEKKDLKIRAMTFSIKKYKRIIIIKIREKRESNKLIIFNKIKEMMFNISKMIYCKMRSKLWQ